MMRLAFVGFGNVARAFARMLIERRQQLVERYGIDWRVTAISTARHGSVMSSAGLDLSEALESVERGDNLVSVNGTSEVVNTESLIENCEADILFETTPLNPLDGEPATRYIRRAISRGINVVTVNKGPVAFAYSELKKMANERGTSFRFEGAVMDGAPVFNMVEYCLPAARIVRISGALNSTTNLILAGMESGRSFDESLAQARRMGIVEANADYDIDGWDSAVKAVALVNVLMDAQARPQDIARRGIRDISLDEVRAAALSGKALRLISRAEPGAEGIKIGVAPESHPLGSPLGSVSGTSNVVVIETDMMGEIALFENDPGVEQTAYALLSDMVRICEGMKDRSDRTA